MVCRYRKIALCFSLSLLLLPLAVGEEVAPVYQRGRDHHQGGATWPYPGGFPATFGYYGFSPQIYAGSWYQRPYPYHLDYFRLRSSSPPAESSGCPCVADGDPNEDLGQRD